MHTLYYVPGDDTIGWSDGGSITLHVPMSSIRSLYRRMRATIGDDGPDESLEGFFDFVKKAVGTVGKVVSSLAKSPIVKAVAGIIPYGATALTVVEFADKALSATKKAIAKKPATHALVRGAAKGDEKAKRAIAALPPSVKKGVARVAIFQKQAFILKAELDAAKRALAAAGYSPRLQQLIRVQRAPWR